MPSIRVCYKNQLKTIKLQESKTLLDLFLEAGIFLQAPCGRQGRCGKCTVFVKKEGQEEFLPVLACQTILKESAFVEIPQEALLDAAIEDFSENRISMSKPSFNKDFAKKEESQHFLDQTSLVKQTGDFLEATIGEDEINDHSERIYSIAVDLGTTTVVVSVLKKGDKTVLASKKEWNQQISYGADVISRAKHCMDVEDGLETLSKCMKGQLLRMSEQVCREIGISLSEVSEICISGNTIMQHLFANINPSSIALAPYQPKTRFESLRAIYVDEFSQIPIYLMPCISGYIGGDITSGLIASGLDQKEGTYLFLDIGTNGEMALGGKDGFICCSVACGPALEGAEISCGMTSVKGAISHLDWQENVCKLKTSVIGEVFPLGLCGSGLIDLLAILLKTGILDETGHLLSPSEAKKEVSRLTMARLKNCLGYKCLQEDENGNGLFYLRTQQPQIFLASMDVRKLQLAKAAIAAGIELLMQEAGKSYDEIDGLFLAGGLGEHLNIEHAAAIGMIPEKLKDKVVCFGNTSLKGAMDFLENKEKRSSFTHLIEKCKYLELSGNSAFQDAFIEHISFSRA